MCVCVLYVGGGGDSGAAADPETWGGREGGGVTE